MGLLLHDREQSLAAEAFRVGHGPILVQDRAVVILPPQSGKSARDLVHCPPRPTAIPSGQAGWGFQFRFGKKTVLVSFRLPHPVRTETRATLHTSTCLSPEKLLGSLR
jgi:hypothetical protein